MDSSRPDGYNRRVLVPVACLLGASMRVLALVDRGLPRRKAVDLAELVADGSSAIDQLQIVSTPGSAPAQRLAEKTAGENAPRYRTAVRHRTGRFTPPARLAGSLSLRGNAASRH